MSQKKRTTERARETETGVCVCVCVCVCVRMYVCVCVCVCMHACVCIPCQSVSAFVRECLRVVSRASPIFTRMRMHVRLWEEGGKEKYI